MNAHKSAVPARNTADDDRTDPKMQAGADLRAAMETALSAKQMSVSGLAREANVQRADIYRWWRGESRPSRNSLARIAEALAVDVAYLREALGDPPRATETPADLVTALRAQADALMALAKELRESREDRVRMAARVRALESQVRALVARLGDAGSPGQSPHPETTE